MRAAKVVEIEIVGQTAIVTGKADIVYRSESRTVLEYLYYTGVYGWISPQWRMLAWQSTHRARHFGLAPVTTPTNHRVSILNRFGNTITAPVVHVKDLGSGKAEVRVETTYHIEDGYDLPATYTVAGKEARAIIV